MNYKILPTPPLPKTQAQASETFRPPPLDGSLTLPELYDWHMHNTPMHPLFVYSDAVGKEHTILWPEAVRAVHRAGRIVQSRLQSSSIDSTGPPKVVAILAAADTITYFTFLAGILRAGHTAFPISTRNSAVAIAHLLGKTNVFHVLVGSESSLQHLATASLDLLSGPKPQLSTLPTFEDAYEPAEGEKFIPLPLTKRSLDDPAVVLHSSGSTAFPKPIVWNHYTWLQISTTPYFGERDLTGVRLACHSMPMFHGMGAMQTGWTATSGIVIASFQPKTPAILPTPDAVMKGSIDTRSDVIFCVPSFAESWSRVPDYVAHLQKVDGILYGGGPLNKNAGNYLYSKGVSIFVLYGCSECGIFSKILPKKIDEDWEYFSMGTSVRSKFVPDGRGNYEFVVLPAAHMLPNVFNTKIDGVDAYASGDLLVPHPTKPDFWRIFGRADDQIIHSTGEKTNPGPLENILNQDPHVQSAVMFGRGKFYAGVAIDPKPDYKFDPSDVDALVSFRQKIWPSVEKLNDFAPQHSRIFKEMILVSKPSKPFTYTAKNTARRQAIINDYEEDIDQLYAVVDESTQPGIALPSNWVESSSLDFTRTVVSNVMKHTLADEDDIFQNGCDSLQATWIRNTILNALRKTSDADTRNLPMNFVYEHPTIASLAEYISKVSQPGHSNATRDDLISAKTAEMQSMLTKYCLELPQHVASVDTARTSHVILLTGSTGGLGSVLLSKLLDCPEVSLVYAINRKGNEPLRDRQMLSFNERALDVRQLSSPKLVLLEGDIGTNHLGLNESVFEEIRTSVTHIIHNAYTVNFNMSLASFESNVAGLRNLVDLALSSPFSTPARFLYTSSVSVLRNHTSDGPIEEKLVDASSAVGSGYSESKWVCEQLLAATSKETSLRPIVFRIGQLSGMSTNGYWNSKDWVPALFKSSIFIECLPGVDNDVSWIPIDIAAQSILDMRDASAEILHIAHPHPVKWGTIIERAAELLRLRVVPYSEWLSKLHTSGGEHSAEQAVEIETRNPALRLREFFTSISSVTTDPYGTGDGATSKDAESMGLKRLDLTNALRLSYTLREECVPLDASHVKKWFVGWGLSA